MNKEVRRGGARPGAGRKPANVETVSMSFRVPVATRKELVDFIKSHDISMADFIKMALDALR